MSRSKWSTNPYARYDAFVETQAFPKYSALPEIGNSSPQPTENNAIVALSNGHGVTQPPRPDSDPGDRVHHLEKRVAVAEKSNRALLEECVRLQSELKMSVRHTDEVLAAERNQRQQMENSLRTSSDLIAELSARLARAEEKMLEGSSALSSLSTQAKTMEQNLAATSHDAKARKDHLHNKVLELRSELEQTQRAKDALERLTYTLQDDMRLIKARLDSQNTDFATVASDLRNKSQRLEEESRSTMEALRKQGDIQNISDQTVGQLRAQIESRLSELRDVMVEMRSKQEQETQERRLLEQTQQMKMSELQAAAAEQARRRDELLHQMELLQREKHHVSEADRLKLQGRLTELQEDINSKLSQKEAKLRDDTQKRITELEKSLREEENERHKLRKELKQSEEEKLDALSRRNQEEMQQARDQIKVETRKLKETTHKLNEAQNLLEKQLEEARRQQQKVMSAEIQSRKKTERELEEKIEELQEKLGMATATLQQSVGGVSGQLAAQVEKLERDVEELRSAGRDSKNKVDKRHVDELQVEVRSAMGERDAANARALADLDARVSAINARLNHVNASMDGKVQNAREEMEGNWKQRLAALTAWQDEVTRTLAALQAQNTVNTDAVTRLEELQQKLDRELDDRVRGERSNREKDVQALRDEIQDLRAREAAPGKPQPPPQDLATIKQSIRKLAESVQTVKTVLGMKIQSEQKLRLEDFKNLREDLNRFKTLIDPLVKGGPRVFVKPERVPGVKVNKPQIEKEAPEINRWSVYTVYRWLKWKEHWMFPVWKKEAEKKTEEDRNNAEETRDNDDDEDEVAEGEIERNENP